MARTHSVAALLTAGAAVSAMLLAGCGTVVVENTFTVRVEDPSGRLGTDDVAVSVFDPTMGDTNDWAGESLGLTTPAQPYRRQLPTTATKLVGDSSPPTRVTAGVYLPQFDPTGYYLIAFDPVAGQTIDYAAGYVTYDYSWETSGAARPTAPPLPMTITAEAAGNAWELGVEVRIPLR